MTVTETSGEPRLPDSPQSRLRGSVHRPTGRGVWPHRDPARAVMIGGDVARNVVGAHADRAVGVAAWVLLALRDLAAHVVVSVRHSSAPGRN